MSESKVQTKTQVITIFVNNKPVEFPDQQGRDTETGRAIKQVAINQGVNLHLDFSLFEVQGSTLQPIGDDADVHLHNNLKLRAVAPDDNS